MHQFLGLIVLPRSRALLVRNDDDYNGVLTLIIPMWKNPQSTFLLITYRAMICHDFFVYKFPAKCAFKHGHVTISVATNFDKQ